MADHLLLMLSSLLLSSLAFSPATSSSPFPPVVDVNGRVLMTGKPYYALSGPLRHPLGLCLPDDVEQNDVVQCHFLNHDPRGFPVAFTRVKDDDDRHDDEDDREHGRVVREDTFYRVQFWDNDNEENDNECSGDDDDDEMGDPEERRRRRSDTTNVWYLKKGEVPRQMFVAVGSKSHAVRSVQFAIKRVTLGYKLVYCVESPKRRGSSFPVCFGVGLIMDDGYNHLGIGRGARPVQFFFKKKTNDDMPPVSEMSRHVVNNTNINNFN